jgi:TPR repeat protein
MKCIICRRCEAANAAMNKNAQAWLYAQLNTQAIWERELDHERIRHAHSLAEGDPTRSFNEFLALSEQGSTWSMNCMGAAFETGAAAAPDAVQAEKWYLRAYDGGSDYGLLQLGRLYLSSQRYAKAEEVFRTGVERGFAPAMFYLARTYSMSAHWVQRREEALVLLEQGSAAGDPSAKKFLARAMLFGWFGARRIGEGVRRIVSLANDMNKLLTDEKSAAPENSRNPRLRFPDYLSRLCQFGVALPPSS